MISITEKTLQDLQFPTVLETISDSCNTEIGKQKALEMVATMQQKEESGSLLWCVAEDLKNTINGMNEDEARVVVTDFEAGTHDLKTCEKAIHDYANKHKSGGSACCPGPAVPGILRVHFGLPESGQSTAPAPEERPKRQRLNIMDFM